MTHDEKVPYHDIMVSAWRIFIKERPEETYSDSWWEIIIKEYEELREPYKGTKLDDYVCAISQTFLDEYERGQKRGKRQKRISETVLPNSQGYHQEELQLSDPVREVGGCEEIIEPFT